MPTVSVIIATRNRAELLRGAIASVQGQTLDDWELLVVDDASTDPTAELVAASTDPRIVHVRMERHSERSVSRNSGLARARAGFVLFLDDDDRLTPRALEVLVRSLERHPRAVASVGAYVLVDTSGQRRRGLHPRRSMERHIWRDSLLGWTAPQGRTLLRTEVVRAAGGFEEGISFAEDWALWLRICRMGPVALVPATVLEYVLHPGQVLEVDPVRTIASVTATHTAGLDPSDRARAERMYAVRASVEEGMRALTELRFADARRLFVEAIRTDPWVVRSPITRPRTTRPLAKAVVGSVIGRAGTVGIRNARSFIRRRISRTLRRSGADG